MNKLESTIALDKNDRDTAANAMQSWSDTTRNEKEREVKAFKEKLINLEKVYSLIPQNPPDKNTIVLWSLAKVILSKEIKHIIIVPDGIGGKLIGKFQLISESSPLGKKLNDKKSGDVLSFNEQSVEIISVNLSTI